MSMPRKPPPENVRLVQSLGNNIRFLIRNQLGDVVQCESFQERKLALLLRRNRQVKKFGSQPITFHYIDSKGKKRSYTPDFIVWYVDGSIEIVEVSLTKRMEIKPDLTERIEAARMICKVEGLHFRLYTELGLPNETEVANLRSFYCKRANVFFVPQISELAHQFLSAYTPSHITVVAEAVGAKGSFLLPQIYDSLRYELWHSDLECDLKKLFCLSTPYAKSHFSADAKIWLPEKGLSHEH